MLTILPRVKLARPDLFHPRIVLAGCPALPEGDGDDAELVAALRKRGLHARWLSWDDPDDAGRRPGDPAGDVGLHRAARRVPGLDAPRAAICSTPRRWWRGTPTSAISPTSPRPACRRCRAGSSRPASGCGCPSGEVVVKPAVGAGSVGAQRFTDADAAREHATVLQADGRTVLVQPYDARVEDGETALVFLRRRSSRTRSPRGRSCRRRASGRCSTSPAPTRRNR